MNLFELIYFVLGMGCGLLGGYLGYQYWDGWGCILGFIAGAGSWYGGWAVLASWSGKAVQKRNARTVKCSCGVNGLDNFMLKPIGENRLGYRCVCGKLYEFSFSGRKFNPIDDLVAEYQTDA